MNILCWNVRGLGKGEKCISIRNLISMHRISLVGLVETKHRRSFSRRVRRMWGNDGYDWCESLASETHSGGLVGIWDPNILRVSQKFIGDRWIILDGYIVQHSFNCCIGIIYGPNDRVGRRQMYESLRDLLGNLGKPTFLIGDFNEVLYPREREGLFRNDLSIREFKEWVQALQLIDLPLHGVKFTWGRAGSQSRLDRCLCSDEWFTTFPDLRLEGLQRSFSDHNPLLLSLDRRLNWGPKPFRMYDCWFLHPEFKSFLSSEWENLPNVGIVTKLKALKGPLRAWSREKFAGMDHKIAQLEKEAHDLHMRRESRQSQAVELARLSAIQHHLSMWMIRRERFWRQKARTYGLSLKDHNSKFFHASTMIRRKRNEITQLMIDGRMVSGVEDLKEEINRYITARFSQEEVPELTFDLEDHPKVSEDQVALLEAMPTREEIKAAVWACGTDKAPGYDGFNFKGIREMWDSIQEDVFTFVIDLLENGSNARAVNITWVTLIPKVSCPGSIDDFRPISMVGALYKIVSKLLSLRLKDVIAPLIDESQSAFMMDR
jgi:endonuclease/exonuclease/phosphatase family protein